MRLPLPIFVLALSTFGIGSTEFVVMGLLPDIAKSLFISIPQAGNFISAYALGVVLGGPALMILGIHVSRKSMLVALMVVFVVGNTMAALSISYHALLLARIMTSVCHGAFIGLASVVAADLVTVSQRTQSISLVFSGGAIANVLGAPVGTYIGQVLGWRWTFWTLVMVGILALVAMVWVLPARQPQGKSNLILELKVFAQGQVLLALVMTACSLGALFASFTYIVPLLTEVSGFSPSAIAPLLALFGVGLVLGNHVGGMAADRHVLKTLAFALLGLAMVLALFVGTALQPIPAAINLFMIGVMGFAAVPGLMSWVIQKAGEAPILAAVMAVSASNVGIALGAYLSGLSIAAGYGYMAPNWVGCMLALAGLGCVAVTARRETKKLRPVA